MSAACVIQQSTGHFHYFSSQHELVTLLLNKYVHANIHLSSTVVLEVPAGSPSRGGDVVVMSKT